MEMGMASTIEMLTPSGMPTIVGSYEHVAQVSDVCNVADPRQQRGDRGRGTRTLNQ